MGSSVKEDERTPDSFETKENASSEAAIEKAVKFWKHPSLASVSVDEKVKYLSSRGLSQEEIHSVWERIAEEEEESVPQEHSSSTPIHSAPTVPAIPLSNTMNQQQQQQYNASMYPQDDDLPPSAMDIAALMTIGGAIGLTAAAAVRWLNGGDFVLFPPATQRNKDIVNEEHINVEPTSVNADEGHVEEEELVQVDDNEDVGEYQHFQQHEAIQDILERLEIHCEKQDAVLQQIFNYTTKKVTDQSMDLLRNHSSKTENSTIARELAGIKAQLEKLSSAQTGNDRSCQKQIEECLTQLQECMKNVTSNATVNDSATAPAAVAGSSLPPLQQFQDTMPTTLPSTSASSSIETSKSTMLRQAITTLAQENDSTTLAAGTQLLYLYVINLSSHPHVPRYRKIFTTNESFQKVQQLKGGMDLLIAVGFEERGNCLEWQGGSDDEDGDVLVLKEAAAALSILKSSNPYGDSTQLVQNALSVLTMRPSTPPPSESLPVVLKTPDFIASPPTTKKHPLLDETGEDSILDISHASEHFESRLESLAQPVIGDFGGGNDDKSQLDIMNDVPQTSLSMRESEEDEEDNNVNRGDENGEKTNGQSKAESGGANAENG